MTTLALAALTAAALTGCSSKSADHPAGTAGNASTNARGAAAGGTAPAGGGATISAAKAAGALPMDAYILTSDQDQRVVRQAMDLVTRDCMKRYGFDYKAPAPDQNSSSSPTKHTAFGNDDIKQAQLWGYHSPQQPTQNQPAEPDDGKNSPQHLVLIGGVKSAGGQAVPAGGCKGEAESKVLGPDLTKDQVTALTGPAGDGSDRTPGGPAGHDPKVQAALTAWKDCMAKAGFTYSTPSDGIVHFLKGPGQSVQPSAPEIATAVADATCKQQVDLNGIWFQAETALENKFIEEHATALNEIQKVHQDQVKRATAIVGTGS